MTADEKTFLDENGYVVLRQVISEALADELLARALELAAADRARDAAALYLGDSQRVWNLVNKGRCFETAITLPRILEFQEYLLGADCILSSFTANLIAAGSPASGLHIDYPMSQMPLPLPNWTFCANSVIMLTDFTLENGATEVIPGSHRRGYGPEPDRGYDDVIQAEGKKGDVIIVNGLIWHGSGANTSDHTRVGLLGFYCRAFMRPQQDHTKLVADAVWQGASPVLRRLLDEKATAAPKY